MPHLVWPPAPPIVRQYLGWLPLILYIQGEQWDNRKHLFLRITATKAENTRLIEVLCFARCSDNVLHFQTFLQHGKVPSSFVTRSQ